MLFALLPSPASPPNLFLLIFFFLGTWPPTKRLHFPVSLVTKFEPKTKFSLKRHEEKCSWQLPGHLLKNNLASQLFYLLASLQW